MFWESGLAGLLLAGILLFGCLGGETPPEDKRVFPLGESCVSSYDCVCRSPDPEECGLPGEKWVCVNGKCDKGFYECEVDLECEQPGCLGMRAECREGKCVTVDFEGSPAECFQQECELSRCDCKCYPLGEAPQDYNGTPCAVNCYQLSGITGCEFAHEQCRETVFGD